MKQKSPLKWLKSYQSSPHSPGVYWFIDQDKKIIYVGKAKDLKNRLASYTRLDALEGKTRSMVSSAGQLKYQVLDSELEALLIEAELIRLHQPKFNILLKDDKSPLYIYFTKTKIPLLKLGRKREIIRLLSSSRLDQRSVVGPFQSSFKTKEVLKLIRPIFKWCEDPFNSKNQTCFYYHLSLCSGACQNQISISAYISDLNLLKKFLKGKISQLIKDLSQTQLKAASETNFELAAKYRDQIEAIKNLLSPKFKLKPDLVLPKLHLSQTQAGLDYLRQLLKETSTIPQSYSLNRIECFDVSNISGKSATVSMVVFSDGKKDSSQYRLFNIKTLDTPNDYQMLKEALARRSKHLEWGVPRLIVIDGGKGQLRAALTSLELKVPVISIVKNPDRLIFPLDLSDGERKKWGFQIVTLDSDHPGLQLVQRLRDEAHRFAKKQHHRLRDKTIKF